MRSQHHRAEGKDHPIPSPCCHASFDTAPDTVFLTVTIPVSILLPPLPFAVACMPSRSQTAAVYENYQPETEALESPSKQAVCKSTQYIPATMIWKRLIEKIWDTFLSYCFSVIVTSGSDTPP